MEEGAIVRRIRVYHGSSAQSDGLRQRECEKGEEEHIPSHGSRLSRQKYGRRPLMNTLSGTPFVKPYSVSIHPNSTELPLAREAGRFDQQNENPTLIETSGFRSIGCKYGRNHRFSHMMNYGARGAFPPGDWQVAWRGTPGLSGWWMRARPVARRQTQRRRHRHRRAP